MRLSLLIFFGFVSVFLSGCSVFGSNNVQVAPYKVLEKEGDIEIRHYNRLVLITAPMSGDMKEQSTPFYKLFDYISGNNKTAEKISMTAPVFMSQSDRPSMSFVLPQNFTVQSAPKPSDPSVAVEEIKNYTVATIRFNGFFNQENIDSHTIKLKEWIAKKKLKETGLPKAAGYNPPFTLPFLRRNEILIPVQYNDQ